MKLTHLGHACVLVEHAGRRIIFDPGNLSRGIRELSPVDALFVTHEHADHLDLGSVGALGTANPELAIFADGGSARALSEADITNVTVLGADGGAVVADEFDVRAIGATHEPIHPDLPSLPNNAYLLGGRLLHPGDTFCVPDQKVDVLLLPLGAPWAKLSEIIDYLRAVAPRIAIPIHQGGLAEAHRQLHCGLLRKLGPADTEIVVLEEGVLSEV